jgi:hypothetical protein
MKAPDKRNPQIGDEPAEQTIELKRARDGVMLTRPQLAADPHRKSALQIRG